MHRIPSLAAFGTDDEGRLVVHRSSRARISDDLKVCQREFEGQFPDLAIRAEECACRQTIAQMHHPLLPEDMGHQRTDQDHGQTEMEQQHHRALVELAPEAIEQTTDTKHRPKGSEPPGAIDEGRAPRSMLNEGCSHHDDDDCNHQ